MPIAVLDRTKNNFSPETQKAFTGMPMTAQYKIAWESPRFWEKENSIYGGISFLKDTVDLVWYPTDRMFSSTGVVIAGSTSSVKTSPTNPRPSAPCQRFRPSLTLRGQPWRSYTPAAPTC